MAAHPNPPNPKPAGGTPPTRAEARHTRTGLWLFLIYVALYAGFMYMAAFKRELMAHEIFTGVNLAIVYGMGLIGGAFVMAILYTLLCGGQQRSEARRNPRGDSGNTENEAAL